MNVNKSGNVVTWLNQAHDEKEAEEAYGGKCQCVKCYYQLIRSM